MCQQRLSIASAKNIPKSMTQKLSQNDGHLHEIKFPKKRNIEISFRNFRFPKVSVGKTEIETEIEIEIEIEIEVNITGCRAIPLNSKYVKY